MAESTEDIKGFLMRVKEESEKYVLKLNIQKTKNMIFSFITLWQIERKKSGSSGRFFFFLWASKSLWMMSMAMKLKDTCSLEEKL